MAANKKQQDKINLKALTFALLCHLWLRDKYIYIYIKKKAKVSVVQALGQRSGCPWPAAADSSGRKGEWNQPSLLKLP